MVFSIHSSPKTQIGTVFYRILWYLASQPAKMSTRRRRDYREEAAIAVDIAAVAAATSKALSEADTSAAIAAVAAAREAKEAETEDMESAIFDFAASIDVDDEHEDDDSFATARGDIDGGGDGDGDKIGNVAIANEGNGDNAEAIDKDAIVDFTASVEFDDEDMAMGLDEANGNADVAIGAGGDISDGNDRGDGVGGGVEWERATKKRKCEMSDTELFNYFDSQLKGIRKCPNKNCNCVAILADEVTRAPVVRYLCWFNAKQKYEQDSIVFEWIKYSGHLKKSVSKSNWFCLPYISEDGDTDAVLQAVRKHVVCSRGLQLILDWGLKRWKSIRKATSVLGTLPVHKKIGKVNYNSIELNEQKLGPLVRHFEHMMKLGEVRATRCVATLVDGTLGHTNRDDDDEAIYLPRYMGIRSCYRRYMATLGYHVQTTATGGIIVTRLPGENENEPVDTEEFVSFPTYYNKWKKSYPNLKVSKPAEDICPYCYQFCNRHRYLANHSIGRDDDDDDEDGIGVEDDVVSDGDMIDGEDGDDTNTGPPSPSHGDNVINPQSAPRQDDKERELIPRFRSTFGKREYGKI